MAAVTICSDFGAKKIKSATVSPSICYEMMGLDAMILVFWMFSFKSTFSLSSLTFVKTITIIKKTLKAYFNYSGSSNYPYFLGMIFHLCVLYNFNADFHLGIFMNLPQITSGHKILTFLHTILALRIHMY